MYLRCHVLKLGIVGACAMYGGQLELVLSFAM